MKKLLMLLAPVILLSLAFRANDFFTVSGVVTDKDGAPIPFVTINVKGTKKGTSADAVGYYKIDILNGKQTLVFSAVGFKALEVAVKGKPKINVVLEAASTQLQEVVVNSAYGIRRSSKSVSYSVQSVNNGYASQSLLSGLNGKVAGLDIRSGDGLVTTSDTRNDEDFNTEDYDKITENKFLKTTDNQLSTFSIDVDAASYSNVRRYLNNGQLPPAGAVRIEELVNYFKYEYPQPANDEPFSINTEMATAPWNHDHQLVLIGLQGKKIPTENLPSSNLVFLVDVSGSMQGPERIGLVKASMKMLVDQLRQQDKVSIVVYAGAAGLVLPATNGLDKTKIKDAIDRLEAGGSTAGGEGIRLAYKTAKESLVKGGNNRVILCTDGDFNVGESSDDAMERLIEEERKSGVFLTVLGYGMGNYKDNKMQKLADKGNGNHAYIDGISEAKKVLVNEFGGTLFTIAKDVKLQVEFNPAKVQGYRLIGYENRMLAKEDFNDDKKDAGELGSGHTVTALYEVIPVGVESDFLNSIDSLKYQSNQLAPLSKSSQTNEILTVKFRYKAPDGDASKLIVHPVEDDQQAIDKTSANFRFAIAVAEFGMLLRNSSYKSGASYNNVLRLAEKAKEADAEGYRSEFIQLVKVAQKLSNEKQELAVEDTEEEKW